MLDSFSGCPGWDKFTKETWGAPHKAFHLSQGRVMSSKSPIIPCPGCCHACHTSLEICCRHNVTCLSSLGSMCLGLCGTIVIVSALKTHVWYLLSPPLIDQAKTGPVGKGDMSTYSPSLAHFCLISPTCSDTCIHSLIFKILIKCAPLSHESTLPSI